MNTFTTEQLNKISHLMTEIEKLSDVEKLFLYLNLPCGRSEASNEANKLKQNSRKLQNNNNNNSNNNNADASPKKPDQETTQTYTWILSHLEVDQNVSLPKQEVYDEYRAFCQTNNFEPLCVADFGKAMKHIFPCIKPRRLGQRGNSRYCYSGLRKRYKLEPPELPTISLNPVSKGFNQQDVNASSSTSTSTSTLTSMSLRLPMSLAETSSSSRFQRVCNPQLSHAMEMDATSMQTGAAEVASVPEPTNSNLNPVDVSMTGAVASEPGVMIQPEEPSISRPALSLLSVGGLHGPGSPDDDDYSHNYQDHFYTSTMHVTGPCMDMVHHHRAAHSTSSELFNNHRHRQQSQQHLEQQPHNPSMHQQQPQIHSHSHLQALHHHHHQQELDHSSLHREHHHNMQHNHQANHQTLQHQHQHHHHHHHQQQHHNHPTTLNGVEANFAHLQRSTNHSLAYPSPFQVTAPGSSITTTNLTTQTGSATTSNGSSDTTSLRASTSGEMTQSTQSASHFASHPCIMNNQFDSICASPFQSPASTPYPNHMTSGPNLLGPNSTGETSTNMQDYYPPSDIIEYPND